MSLFGILTVNLFQYSVYGEGKEKKTGETEKEKMEGQMEERHKN